MTHASGEPGRRWSEPGRHASLVGRDWAGSSVDDPTGTDVDTGEFEPVVDPDADAWYPPPQPSGPPVVADPGPGHEVSSSPEHVAVGQAVSLVLMALVGLGWVKIDDTVVNLVASAIAAVVVAMVTLVVRSQVWTRAAVRRELARRGIS